MQITNTLARVAELFPNRTATIFGDRQRTWAEVASRVARLAAALRRLGVEDGDHVAVIAFNSDRYVELFYAIPWAGAEIIPLNVRWAEAEILTALGDISPAVIALDDSFLHLAGALRAGISGLRAIIWMGECDPNTDAAGYEKIIAAHPPCPGRSRSGTDPYTLFFTGGTTGTPRGVSISHQNVIFASLSYIAELQLTHEMIHMHVGGFFHLSGAGHMWYTTMVGGTHVILPKFEVGPVLQALHRHRPTNTVLLPTMVNMLLHHPDASKYDLTSMKLCIYGGSSMPQALITAFMTTLPSWSFVQVYAMTESTGLATFLPWQRHFDSKSGESKMRSVGYPALGVTIRIVDIEGNEVPRGEVGEIAVSGLNVMPSYRNQPALSRSAVHDGFLHSGDLGSMDRDGFVYVVDRAKDMIISGGENVYSAEVENALYAHPAVRECAVIGIPHENWGEAVHAVVVLKEDWGAKPSELIAHCRARIAGFKCPKSIDIRSERLPQTPAGKIKKDVLRAAYWKGYAKSKQKPPPLVRE